MVRRALGVGVNGGTWSRDQNPWARNRACGPVCCEAHACGHTGMQPQARHGHLHVGCQRDHLEVCGAFELWVVELCRWAR